MKNLLLLPSILASFALLILPQLEDLSGKILEQKSIKPQDISEIIFLLIGSAATLTLRYSESEDVHTPEFLPGRNKESEQNDIEYK